ncbi:MAG: DUF4167 domain-containing protein [Pseudomonadota bacterium]
MVTKDRRSSSEMRPAQKQNRARGRGNRKNGGGGGGNNLNRVYDSAGPEGKVRGTPQQIVDKYLSLARDAQTAGDRVTAENFLQHAEHYQRIVLTAMGAQAEQRREAPAQPDEEESDAAPPAVAEAATEEATASTDDGATEARPRRRRGRRNAETDEAGEAGQNGSSSAHAEASSGREIDGFGTIEPDGGSTGGDLLIETEEIARSQPRRRRNGASQAEPDAPEASGDHEIVDAAGTSPAADAPELAAGDGDALPRQSTTDEA